MVFMHPEYLWGLISLLVPVLIHLFDFRKNRKVFFSDIRFLKQVKHASRKPLKLKQWLILMSRLGFITFLVLVFAQPILPTSRQQNLTNGIKLIYIDNSMSMSAQMSSEETALDRARSFGQYIIDNLPQGQQVIVVDNSNVSLFSSPQGIKEASEQLVSVQFSEETFSLAKLGIALKEVKRRGLVLSDVFIISDFQKSTTRLQPNALDSTLNYWVAPLIVTPDANCVVDSVYQLTSEIISDDKVEIQVVVRNTGASDRSDVPVKVIMGDRQVSAATIRIPANTSKNVSFPLGKVNKIEPAFIQLEDYPISFDNRFYFALSDKNKIRILIVNGLTSSNYISQVYGNNMVFSVEEHDARILDHSLFENADFVVLNQVDSPTPELLSGVKQYMQGGGSVLVVPGLSVDVRLYQNLGVNIRSTPGESVKNLKRPDSKDPFFSTMLEPTVKSIKMPSATPVWNWGNDRSALLKYEDDMPYLSEVSKNLFFLSSPLIDSLSNVQTHALFVPIMYRLASNSSTPEDKLFARIQDESVDIEIDSASVKDILKLSQNELEIIPNKVKIGNRWRLRLPKNVIKSGIYGIYLKDRLEGYLAFNLNPKESQLQPLTDEELSTLFDAYKYSLINSHNGPQTNVKAFDAGTALWKYALVICLVFLLIEGLLIRFL